jgi:heptosyltransferase-2
VNILKILIVKIGAIGDVVMSLSMLAEIDRRWPNSEITWVCGGSVSPLIQACHRVDKILSVNERKLLRGGAFGALVELLPLWLRLMGKRFDLIVTGHSDSRYRLLSLTALGITRRSFGNSPEGRWPVPGRYHADEYVRLITGQNGPDAPLGVIPCFHFPLGENLSRKIEPEKKVVALAPGGAVNVLRNDGLRRWSLENYARLADQLLQNGYQVLITGSESDGWVREAFKKLPVTDLVGATSITELTALYGRADLVITHDSGPLHLAVASGRPVIGLFGPTIPWEKVPRHESVRVIWGGDHLACRPCYDGKNYAICPGNECLRSVTADKVYGEAKQILGAD